MKDYLFKRRFNSEQKFKFALFKKQKQLTISQKIVELFSQLNFSQGIFINKTSKDLFSTQLLHKLAFF